MQMAMRTSATIISWKVMGDMMSPVAYSAWTRFVYLKRGGGRIIEETFLRAHSVGPVVDSSSCAPTSRSIPPSTQ
jgi:hypothetical protein